MPNPTSYDQLMQWFRGFISDVRKIRKETKKRTQLQGGHGVVGSDPHMLASSANSEAAAVHAAAAATAGPNGTPAIQPLALTAAKLDFTADEDLLAETARPAGHTLNDVLGDYKGLTSQELGGHSPAEACDMSRSPSTASVNDGQPVTRSCMAIDSRRGSENKRHISFNCHNDEHFSKLASAIQKMSRRDLERSLEHAVRLIFELEKESQSKGRHDKEREIHVSTSKAPFLSVGGMSTTSNIPSSRPSFRSGQRSSITSVSGTARSTTSNAVPNVNIPASEIPTIQKIEATTDGIDYHALVDADFEDFHEAENKFSQNLQVKNQPRSLPLPSVAPHYDDDDDSSDSDATPRKSTGRRPGELVVTDSMEIEDLMGSQSLDDIGDFIEHSNLKKEKDTKGNRIINDYVVLRNLGQGAYGKVKLAHHRDDPKKRVAIKIIDKSLTKNALSTAGSGESQIRREIAIMKKLRHKNIVSLHAVVDDPEADKMYIIMDYIGQGHILKEVTKAHHKLQNLIYEPLEEATVVNYIRQLVDGLRYMHKHGIAHRDIKPANLLLRGDRVFITDFGVSELCNEAEHAEQVQMKQDFSPFSDPDAPPASPMRVQGHKGTPLFWPPEMFEATESDSFHDGERQDLWALGVTVFMMLTGKAPFKSTQFNNLRREVTSDDEVTVPDNLSLNAQFLLRAMLSKDPGRRLGLLEVRHHPFMGGYDRRTAVQRGSVFVYADDADEEDAITVTSGAVLPTKYLIDKAKPALVKLIHRIRERIRLRKEREAAGISSSNGSGNSQCQTPISQRTSPAGAAPRNDPAAGSDSNREDLQNAMNVTAPPAAGPTSTQQETISTPQTENLPSRPDSRQIPPRVPSPDLHVPIPHTNMNGHGPRSASVGGRPKRVSITEDAAAAIGCNTDFGCPVNIYQSVMSVHEAAGSDPVVPPSPHNRHDARVSQDNRRPNGSFWRVGSNLRLPAATNHHHMGQPGPSPVTPLQRQPSNFGGVYSGITAGANPAAAFGMRLPPATPQFLSASAGSVATGIYSSFSQGPNLPKRGQTPGPMATRANSTLPALRPAPHQPPVTNTPSPAPSATSPEPSQNTPPHDGTGRRLSDSGSPQTSSRIRGRLSAALQAGK